MNLDVDPGKLLYAVGALFGIAAVLYFARDVVFDLSITVRAILLLLTFLVLLTGALVTSRPGIATVGYVLSAATYLAFLWYALSRFDVGADGTFLALLLSTGLFLGLGYLLRERAVAPSPAVARWVVVGIVLTGAMFVGADLAASGVDYRMTVHEEGVVGDRGEIELGTVTAANRFVFRESIDMPRPLVCSYGFDRRERPVELRVGAGTVPRTVPGGGTVTATMSTRFGEEELDAVDGPIPVDTAAACPADADEPRIVVVADESFPEPPR